MAVRFTLVDGETKGDAAMAQSALTVTPPNPTPPTNMSCTGATPPNPPNYTKT